VVWVALVGSPSTNKSPALRSVISLAHKLEEDLLEPYREALRAYLVASEVAKHPRARWESEVREAVENGA